MASPLDAAESSVEGHFNASTNNGLDPTTNNPAITDTATAALNTAIYPIQKIVGEQQFTFNGGLMGRGLTLDNFNSSAALTVWKQSYPYRLLVLRVHSDGHYGVIAEFRLPINPQELTITTPFAIKTTITSQGVLEEHNGIPIKMIKIRGTTGFWISRPSAPKSTGNSSILGTVFGGTIQAAQGVQNQLGKLTSSPIGVTANVNTTTTDANLVMSGYFQYHLLRLFVETYAITKTQPDNQDLRLALEISKDRVTYLVTPQLKTMTKTVVSPMEYLYTLDFLAWGTVPNAGFATANQNLNTLTQNSGNQLLTIMNSLIQAQTVMNSFANVIGAVRADIQSNILGPINNMVLLVKSVVGVAQSIADFPQSLQQSLQNSVIATWNNLKSTLNNSPALTTAGPTSPVNSATVAAATTAIANITQQNSGSSALNGTANATYIPAVLGNISLTQAINISQLNLTPAQQAAVNTATNAALNTTNNQVLTLINNLQNMATALEPSISAGDPLAPEWDILYQAADTVTQLYAMILDNSLLTSPNAQAQGQTTAPLTNSAMNYWTAMTTQSAIPYTAPVGKFAIPFPYKSTLEQLALLYLQDATLWMEIASLNGLQYPYVDEEGFVVVFANNGVNNQFNITTATNLFVGQTIYLTSNTQITSQRKILAINPITTTNYLITVDGASNLNLFTTADAAQFRAYLPYTVNSMQQIYIPSATQPNPNELETTPLTFINDNLDLVKFSRIDWLLTPSGDLACTQSGFQNLAFGTTNLIQAATLKLITPPNGLILHPEFGALPQLGDSVADIDSQAQIERINVSFQQDERFNTPQSVSITLQPGVEAVSVVASVAQGNGILPIVVPLTGQ